jgi:pimeloyl-ACP methyl ester carboxylesterase
MALTLAYKEFGAGSPIVILHGLFGSARNWQAIAKRLAAHHHVYTLDLRNHGTSPWGDSMSYHDMAEDVAEFVETHALAPATVLGHSMGGKVAMALALSQPALVRRLVVADIAPVTYAHSFLPYVQAMQDLNLAGIARRDEADAALSEQVPDATTRMLLLQNLILHDRHFDWRINLPALAGAASELLGFPQFSNEGYQGRALFVHGERSAYVTPAHYTVIRKLFPRAEIVAIAEAGHWLHVDQPVRFLETVQDFFRSDRS